MVYYVKRHSTTAERKVVFHGPYNAAELRRYLKTYPKELMISVLSGAEEIPVDWIEAHLSNQI